MHDSRNRRKFRLRDGGVDIRRCEPATGGFGPPEPASAGGWAVGVANGPDGSDVVETFANLESALCEPDVRFAVAAGETGGSVLDVLLFQDGNSGSPIVFHRKVPPVPTLTHYGALLLVFILGGAGWYFSRKTGRTTFRVLAICLTATAVAAAVAWAACAPDGDPSDWEGASPLAVDNENENGDGPDILRFYAKDSGDQTCFRIDARIFFKTPPVLDLDGPADDPGGDVHYETAFTEDSGPTAIVDPANLSLTERDDAPIVSATVVLESRPDGASEILDAQATGAVGVSYDSSTGTLTLAGPGSLADFQQTLRSVTYDNTKINPTADDRNVRFEAKNQYGPSAPSRTLFHVLPRNHAPSFDKGPDQTVDEDAGPQVAKAWAANIDDGDPGLAQTLSFLLGSNTNESLFAAEPAVDPATGDLTYEPAADANGSATVEILPTDDGGVENGGRDTSASQTFAITVNPVNDPPSAEDDSATFDEDSSGNIIDALANDDCSPDQDETLVISSVGTPNQNGVASVAASGAKIEYTPAADFFGAETFTYTIDDGNGGSDTATVAVTVNSRNDDPDAADDTFTVDEDSSKNSLDPLANDDCSPDQGETLAISSVGTPNKNGVASVAASGAKIEYTPAADFFGAETFTYTIGDGNGGSDTATVTVTVLPVDDPLTAEDDSFATVGNTEIAAGGATPTSLARVEAAGNLLYNDADVDAPTALFVSKLNGAGGTAPFVGTSRLGRNVTLYADGSFVYAPPKGVKNKIDARQSGGADERDSFQYSASNGIDETEASVYVEIADSLVWYVHNDPNGEALNQIDGANSGRSDDPFDKLSDGDGDSAPDDPEDASDENEWIFVFGGDGTSAGQDKGIALKNGQKLCGHTGTTLTVGAVTVQTPNPPSNRPKITSPAGAVVVVDATTSERAGIAIQGLDISGWVDNAINVSSGGANDVEVSISNNLVTLFGNRGFELKPVGSGNFFAAIEDNDFSTGTFHICPIELTTVAASDNRVELAVNRNANLNSYGGMYALMINALKRGADGKVYVKSFDGNTTAVGPGQDCGIYFDSVVFDANPNTEDFDPVHVNDLEIGNETERTKSYGLEICRASGDLRLHGLKLFSDQNPSLWAVGTGLYNDDGPDTGFYLLVDGASKADAVNDMAVMLESLTTNAAFEQIASTNTVFGGVILQGIDGSFRAGPSSFVELRAGIAGDRAAFSITGGSADVTYTGTITCPAAYSVKAENNTGGTITFGGAIIDSGKGVHLASNPGTVFNFNGGMTLTATNPPSTTYLFNAQDGGELNVTGVNTVGSDGGPVGCVGVRIKDVNIGEDGVTFQKIFVDGSPSNGIVLENTGDGAFVVEGDGTSANNGSGAAEFKIPAVPAYG